ncbi:MAG: HPF/RaiA family ribosome-associated protein [Bacteroidetes bacterium]|nr:HPF/RaiA family ribosome-associated protein [Bacteroidota bacterium]
MNDTEKIVEFVVTTQGAVLVSKEQTDDFHKSLSSAYEKMLTQIKRQKEKK